MWTKWFCKSAEFVALEGHVLTVQSKVPLKGERVRLRVQQNDREVGCGLRPVTVREVPGGYVYTGLVTDGLSRLEPGARPIEAEEQTFLRSGQRLPFSTRVLSRELPGFRALTIDLSPGGLQLEVESGVEVGTNLTLCLDRGEHQDALTVKGRVAWCHRLPEGRCRVGLEFFKLEAGARRALDALYQSLAADQSLSVSERLIRILRQSGEHALRRPIQQPFKGRLLGYQQQGQDLRLDFSTASLTIRGLSGFCDRRNAAGLDCFRVELSGNEGLWSYRFLNQTGVAVLEVSTVSGPDEVFGPSFAILTSASQ